MPNVVDPPGRMSGKLAGTADSPTEYDLLPSEPPRYDSILGKDSNVSILRVDGLDVALLTKLDMLSAVVCDLKRQMCADQGPSGVIVFPVDAVVGALEPSPAELALDQISLHRSNSDDLNSGAEEYINWYWANRRAVRTALFSAHD